MIPRALAGSLSRVLSRTFVLGRRCTGLLRALHELEPHQHLALLGVGRVAVLLI